MTELGDRAFEYCEALKSVCLPAGLTKLGYGVFGYCSSLENLTIADGNTRFKYADGLILSADGTTVEACMPYKKGVCEIPKGVKNIAWHAFEDCVQITDLIMPETVVNIGVFAFDGCKKLANVRLSSKIKKLNCSVFSACKSLQHIELPEKLTAIGTSAFELCGLKEITIPETVKTLKGYAFDQCRMNKVTIYSNVKINMRSLGRATFELYAKNIPLDKICKGYQPCALLGYAEMYCTGEELQTEITEGYKKFVAENTDKVTESMLKKPAVADFVLSLQCLNEAETEKIVQQIKKLDNAELNAVLAKHKL